MTVRRKILEGYSGKKRKTHCVMEPSCDWICNPVIVWLDEFAKNSGQNRKPTGCPRFDPVFGSNNNPLFGPLSMMIIAEHSMFAGVTTVVWHLGRKGGNPPT